MKNFIIIAASALLLASCARQKRERIAEWESYKDPYFKCTFSYPKGWAASTEGGRVSIYSSPEGAQKFFDPTSKSPDASQIIVAYEKSTAPSLDAILSMYTEELKSSGFSIDATNATTVSGVPAFEVTYKGIFENGAKMTSTRLLTFRDSTLYYASYAGFNDFYDRYRTVLDTLTATFRLPEPKVVQKDVDPALPSSSFQTFNNKILEISHPDNFEAEFPAPKGEITFSMELKGYRADCTIRIDAFPAKGLTTEKVFEQNSKFYKKTSQGQATINGVKALYLDYVPTKGIESRVYFLVKNNTVYRVITNYFQSLKKDFAPVFQKTVASLKVH